MESKSVSATAALAGPGVIGTVQFNSSPPPGIDISTLGTFPLSGPGGFLQASASGTPQPKLTAEADITQFSFGRASILMQYQVHVLGPAGDVAVSVSVTGAAAGFANPTDPDPFVIFAVKAAWSLDDLRLGLAPVFSESIESGSRTGTFGQSFKHSIDLTLTTDHLYRVTLIADAGSRGGTVNSVASAFIDPVFSFGSGVGTEYSFVFSPSIGNTAVPLPNALLLLGSALCGTWGWRARRCTVHAR